jgi:hypothetical protein
MYIRHCELVMENWHVYVWCFNFVYAWWILLSCYFRVSVVYITYTANDNIVIILPHCVTYIDIMLLCYEHRLVHEFDWISKQVGIELMDSTRDIWTMFPMIHLWVNLVVCFNEILVGQMPPSDEQCQLIIWVRTILRVRFRTLCMIHNSLRRLIYLKNGISNYPILMIHV